MLHQWTVLRSQPYTLTWLATNTSSSPPPPLSALVYRSYNFAQFSQQKVLWELLRFPSTGVANYTLNRRKEENQLRRENDLVFYSTYIVQKQRNGIQYIREGLGANNKHCMWLITRNKCSKCTRITMHVNKTHTNN